MSLQAKHRNLLFLAASVAVLTACGAEEISSPGSGGNINITNNTPPPPPPPPPPTVTLVTPAPGCPTIDDPAGLKDLGTITGPTGTYRNCELPARITRSSRLSKISGLLYSIGGRVDVGADLGAAAASGQTAITLTIDPGVVLFGSTGVSWLVVNRGHRINATGTATSPIVFTSRDNVLGLATDDSQGQWGGVVLLGRAPITDCTVAPNATPGSVNCERQTEGAVDPAYYGGATPTDNSGTMKYVQIRYSGYVLSGNSELQALTTGGVGSGTVLEYIQSHNSSDDGLEFFGGTHNAKRFVITGADDDTLDLDTGYKGLIQYVIGVQKSSGNADSMIELDSTNALENQSPRTWMRIANFTLVHKNPATGNGAAMRFRGGADVTMLNGVLVSPMTCLRLDGANMLTTDAAIDKFGPPVFRSVAMQCGTTPFAGSSGLTAQQVSDVFNIAANNNTATLTSTLTGGFVNGANETARTAMDPKTVNAGFDTTTYIGAVKDANDTWYAGWTCNSATANFGSTSKSCTTIP
jgi:hypothetical protein